MKLTYVAQQHPAASAHLLNDSTDAYVGIPISAQLADLLAVFTQAHDGEAAFCIGCRGRAKIQESRAVG